jgi:hypothetical protein
MSVTKALPWTMMSKPVRVPAVRGVIEGTTLR